MIIVLALFAVLQYFTNASNVLFSINPVFFALANLFFILSIFIWVFSWAFLIKKHELIRYRQLFVIGFSAVFGSLTPVQAGAEYLRSVRLKELFGVSYSESLSASLINKGAKFFILALLGLVVLLLFVTKAGFENLNSFLLLGLVSGFGV
ncbi:MAG: lysylphosphatidylglycerol synthase domain-containing protein, partial [Candidatus Woesearchaeota archaeon]|nr:lysylphosphatidylglycerol synthase domain-containing protein [Candidatus Woesearchaeota archaeon]